MRPFLISLAATVLIGALTGWIAAGGGAGALRDDQTPWSLRDHPQLGDAERLRLYSALMATNHLGERPGEQENAAPEGAEDQTPRIAGAWSKDGEIALSFHSAGQGYITAGVGDALPGGWIVTDASLERVILERNGEIREVTVFPYDNPGI